jgi:hypothetical protein
MRRPFESRWILGPGTVVGLACALIGAWGLGSPLMGVEPALGDKADARVLDQPPSGFFTSIAFAHGFKAVKDVFQTDRYKPDRPATTFTADVESIFLVFDILPRENPAHILGQWYLEQGDGRPEDRLLFEEGVYLQTSQDSGFLECPRPKEGWVPGNYKVKIHLGEKVTEASQLGTLRFTIVSAK